MPLRLTKGLVLHVKFFTSVFRISFATIYSRSSCGLHVMEIFSQGRGENSNLMQDAMEG